MRSLIILLLLLSAVGTVILLTTGISKATALALIIVMTVSAVVLISISRFSPRRARVAQERPEVERALAKLALELPGPNWLAVVSTDGFMASCFPRASIAEMEDRLSTMSAAVFSLGSRISRELRSGDLRYSIVAGTEAITLTVALGEDYMLSTGVPSSVSLDSVLDTVHQSLASLQQTLSTHQSANSQGNSNSQST